MNEFELNLRLKQEMEALAPNRLEALLAACEQTPQQELNIVSQPRQPRRIHWPRMAAVAAAFAILIGGVFYGVNDLSRSQITVDAGAEFTMTVNGFDRVKHVYLAPSARDVIDADALVGMSLDKAVDKAARELVAADCLNGNANGVLVSVKDAGNQRSEILGKHVTEQLTQAASSAANFTPAILFQQIRGEQSGIDVLKNIVVANSAGITQENAARLSVQDLLYAVKSQGISWADGSLTGSLANWTLESAKDAESRVMDYVGLDSADSIFSSVLSVFSDQLAYRVTSSNWEYWVSAATGEILNRGYGWSGANPAGGTQSGYSYGYGSYYAGDPVQDTVDFVKDVIDEPRRIKGFVDFIDRIF